MAYELGGTFNYDHWTMPIVTIDTKNVYTGFRAFARNEATGDYREVFQLVQEQLFVQGVNQGACYRATHDTREEAKKFASQAYYRMNKGVQK
ncbi:hypothetical protein PHIM7_161 [Sinorhizobium phage phiM7]|uniref:Uncharacterized protein n=2 Tax=Emdodecavirus TaxID=1980937 RepID=S5MB57_9CAUD|nr:hypothetical protein AB690_gp337 [Sinorhizobium phage phiM12]YP_009601286.1 hypothetical protein FDH46_gp317 [Sinorhizobium phage phiM7]AGR47863.1 hypothetical protein SmphiM12_231 [Sinorhizobium phage phiM12]AKF12707.1 hypothetical protein PHIM7_161 [Sinorhizobium phage phiM7]AKF13066.1 hypothetical protein PHIM19_161 [Sinorhizobium phage phiM19]